MEWKGTREEAGQEARKQGRERSEGEREGDENKQMHVYMVNNLWTLQPICIRNDEKDERHW